MKRSLAGDSQNRFRHTAANNNSKDAIPEYQFSFTKISKMAVKLLDPDDVLAYLTITTPTSAQSDAMEAITNSVEADVKRFCRWCVTSKIHIDYLPQPGSILGIPLRTTSRFRDSGSWQGQSFGVARGQDRLQLPQMYVTVISEVKEDIAFDFGSDTVLTVNDDYRIEDKGGSGKSGGVMRVGSYWPSVPLSIKLSYTAGFSEADLAGEHNGLRFRAMREAISQWFLRQKELATYVTGLGGDTSGLIREEKIGPYEVKFGGFGDGNKGGPSVGMSPEFKAYLQEAGYVFMGVGV